MATSKARKGLRLTLGGAPLRPHSVVGFPGFYWPDSGTPVGLPDCPSEEQAKAADKDPGCPLELVDVTEKDVTTYLERCRAELGPHAFRSLAEAIAVGGDAGEIAREQAANAAGKDEQ